MAEFEIFRSNHNSDHYVAILADDEGANAVRVRTSHNLNPLVRITKDERPHLGLDRVAAERAIKDHGFYAFALHVEERHGHD